MDAVTTKRAKWGFRVCLAVALMIGAMLVWPVVTTCNRRIIEHRMQARAEELQGNWVGMSDPVLPGVECVQFLEITQPLNRQDVELFSSAWSVQRLELPGTGLNDQDVVQLLQGKTDLRYLDLSDNRPATGALSSIAALPELEDLKLDRVPLSASALAQLARAPKLQSLSLRECSLSAAALQAIGRSGTIALYLDHAHVEDAGLAHLAGVQYLWLNYTNVTDAGIEQLASVANLELLQVKQTAIIGRSLRALRSMKRLEMLQVDNSAVTDGDLQHLMGLPRLTHLSLNDCAISDASIDDLLQFKALDALSLGGTQVTQDGLLRLAELRTLQTVAVDFHRITAAGVQQFQQRRPDVKMVFLDQVP